jgi:hypothetical protein
MEMAAWTNNTNTNVLRYDMMSLVTGKSVIIPGVSCGSVATDSVFDSEAIKLILERHLEIMKKFREVEYSAKLKTASEQRNRKFNYIQYKENDWVFYQDRRKKAWNGPVHVFCHRGCDIFVWANGDLKKVTNCKVQIYNVHEPDKETKEEDATIPAETYDEIDSDDEVDEGPRTRSKGLADKRTDTVGAYCLTAEKAECFEEAFMTYVVELPVRYYRLPEVVEAKEKEVKDFMGFDTFEEVDDEGKKTVGSRWVITKKEKHDDQKTDYKARIVAKGFHEVEKCSVRFANCYARECQDLFVCCS